MIKENSIYIKHLQISDIPWHRLTTAFGRATKFPDYFAVLEKMNNYKKIEQALSVVVENIEHQGTLWHATPFSMIFLCRILNKAICEARHNIVAFKLTEQLMNVCWEILQCVCDGDEMEHSKPLPYFSDMLKNDYLWTEEYDEEIDELRWEEDEVFSDNLFYSFFFYSREVVRIYRYIFEQVPDEFDEKAKEILKLL